jgi:hypothetical protein
MPHPGCAAAVNVGSYIYVLVHGRCLLRYDPVSDTYKELSLLPLPEWYTFDVVALDNFIYVLGGATVGRWTQEGYAYDVRNNSWSNLPCMAKPRRRCAAALVLIPKIETNQKNKYQSDVLMKEGCDDVEVEVDIVHVPHHSDNEIHVIHTHENKKLKTDDVS